jgi:ribosomal protein L36
VAAAMAELPSDGKCVRRESRLFQICRSPDQRQRLLGRATQGLALYANHPRILV